MELYVCVSNPCLSLLQLPLRQCGLLVVAALMRAEWRFSMMASGVQFVMITGNCVVDRSSVEVWDSKVFKIYIKKLILDKVIKHFFNEASAFSNT